MVSRSTHAETSSFRGRLNISRDKTAWVGHYKDKKKYNRTETRKNSTIPSIKAMFRILMGKGLKKPQKKISSSAAEKGDGNDQSLRGAEIFISAAV